MIDQKGTLNEQQKFMTQEVAEKYGWELSPVQVTKISKFSLTELYWHRKNNTGPKFRKRIGKGKNTKVLYPVIDLVAYLTSEIGEQ